MSKSEEYIKISKRNLPQLYDVEFEIDINDSEVAKIKAHKFVLSSGSEVFKNLFYGRFKTNESQIHIKNIDYCTFHEMIDFLYGKPLNLRRRNMKSIMQLFTAFDHYGIDEGKIAIGNHIRCM